MPSPSSAGIERFSANLGWKHYWVFSVRGLAHLAFAAFLALALLSSGVSLAALLFPPFEPPIFPKATACGFFFGISEPLCLNVSKKSNC